MIPSPHEIEKEQEPEVAAILKRIERYLDDFDFNDLAPLGGSYDLFSKELLTRTQHRFIQNYFLEKGWVATISYPTRKIPDNSLFGCFCVMVNVNLRPMERRKTCDDTNS